MSHPLGALSDNMTAYAIYATAQSEMRRAYALIDQGDLDAAAEPGHAGDLPAPRGGQLEAHPGEQERQPPPALPAPCAGRPGQARAGRARVQGAV